MSARRPGEGTGASVCRRRDGEGEALRKILVEMLWRELAFRLCFLKELFLMILEIDPAEALRLNPGRADRGRFSNVS